MSTFNPNRRRVLQAGAAAAAMTQLPGVEVIRGAHAASAGSGKTLVTIHLTGGVDYLNFIVPRSDATYYSVRGGFAIPKANALVLDDRNGLHPSMRGLKALYDRRRVAIVHGVGYPTFDYSHFQASEIYWSGDPLRRTTTGWLGRTLDTMTAGIGDPSALTGVGVAANPGSLIARRFTAPALPAYPDWFWLPVRGTEHGNALRKVLNQPPTTTNYLYDGYLKGSGSAIKAYTSVQEAGALPVSVTYPDTYFGNSMKFTSQLLKSDNDVRVVAVEQGNYDTHENQAGQLKDSLDELDAGLKAFSDDLDASGRWNNTMVLLWSEFGRRIEPNEDNGTDHGSAQAMILIGTGVRAGIVGTHPSLVEADLVDWGNMAMRTDFRRVYATLLSGWLGLDATSIMGASHQTLPILV